MSRLKEVKRRFFNTLKDVSENAGESFSGIGLLLYETGIFSDRYHSDLRPSFSCPKDIFLGEKKCIQTLLEIADRSNPLHDGFIFFNEDGKMTHVSQYFAPPPVDGIIPDENYGARYRAAQYGSLLDGVILTGVVNHDHKYFVFSRGKSIVKEEL